MSTLMLLLTSAHAAAQQQETMQVLGAVGGHWLWNDEQSMGLGVSAGGGLGLDLSGRLNVRFRVFRSHNERDFQNGVVFTGDGVRMTGEVLVRLADGPRSAFVGLGAGVFSNRHVTIFGPDPNDPRGSTGPSERFDTRRNPLVVGGLAGWTALSKGRMRVQPEVSVWMSREFDIEIEPAVVVAYTW